MKTKVIAAASLLATASAVSGYFAGKGHVPRSLPAALAQTKEAETTPLLNSRTQDHLGQYAAARGVMTEGTFDHRNLKPVDRGIVTIAARQSVAETADKLASLIKHRNMTLFARIDFSADARRVGMVIPPMQLLIFGNPRAGTPIMQAVPTAALDLPLKALVWEDFQHRVSISYNSVEYLQHRHRVPGDLMKQINGVLALVDAAAAG